MQRRTYLGLAATGMIGSVAGCTSSADGTEYPPYPDSESTELSGDSAETTDSFEISQDGPTLLDLEHTGSGSFTVHLVVANAETDDTNSSVETGGDSSTETETEGNETETEGNETTTTETGSVDDGTAVRSDVVTTIVSATGPYDGRTIHSVDLGSYALRVEEADAEWTATVYDLPAYDDGVGMTLPITREGGLNDVIGPVNFGKQQQDVPEEDRETTTFNFSVTGEGVHSARLVDRNGIPARAIANARGEMDDTVEFPVSGVGYIEIRSFSSWSIEAST
jgi:hypothetical protein